MGFTLPGVPPDRCQRRGADGTLYAGMVRGGVAAGPKNLPRDTAPKVREAATEAAERRDGGLRSPPLEGGREAQQVSFAADLAPWTAARKFTKTKLRSRNFLRKCLIKLNPYDNDAS